jgi:hypothetical protein
MYNVYKCIKMYINVYNTKMLTVHRRQEHPPVAELPRQRDPPEAPPDEDQDTAEMMVGGGTPGG